MSSTDATSDDIATAKMPEGTRVASAADADPHVRPAELDAVNREKPHASRRRPAAEVQFNK
eukprot:2603573-Alexandrium_andersonii.AAC.1